MSEVIVVTSGKGGVGKTTITANLSIALSKLGKKVIAIDTDIGLRNLDVVMGLENHIIYNIVDVIVIFTFFQVPSLRIRMPLILTKW